MTRPVLRVALPWLQPALAAAVADATLPRLEALGWLGGRGRMSTHTPGSWREWLLEPCGGAPALAAAPAGPVVAGRHGQPVDGSGSWCLAQPVHLSAGLDHLRMGALQAAHPADQEAAELAATVSRHFGAGEPAVAAFVDGAWLLRFTTAIECSTQPPDAVVGHDVHDSMPAGRDGARVRSLMNEIQMLLHEHPVNLRRERSGRQPINGWWLWGFGAQAQEPGAAAANWSLQTDDPWLRALWHGTAWPVDTATPAGNTLIASSEPPATDGTAALAALDAGLLTWLARQVQSGAVAAVDLLAGERLLTIRRAARWSFWRRPVPVSRWLE